MLTQVDLQALRGSQAQSPTAMPRTVAPIEVEPVPSIDPIEFSPLSLSTPALNLEFRALDVSKAWVFGEKKQSNPTNSKPEVKPAKQQVLLSSAIDE